MTLKTSRFLVSEFLSAQLIATTTNNIDGRHDGCAGGISFGALPLSSSLRAVALMDDDGAVASYVPAGQVDRACSGSGV